MGGALGCLREDTTHRLLPLHRSTPLALAHAATLAAALALALDDRRNHRALGGTLQFLLQCVLLVGVVGLLAVAVEEDAQVVERAPDVLLGRRLFLYMCFL